MLLSHFAPCENGQCLVCPKVCRAIKSYGARPGTTFKTSSNSDGDEKAHASVEESNAGFADHITAAANAARNEDEMAHAMGEGNAGVADERGT